MRVYLGPARFVVNASLERINFHTAWVRLFNGDYVKRHKRRDFVDFDADKREEYRIKPIIKRVHFWNRLVSLLKRIWATLVRPIGQQGSKGEMKNAN